MSRIVGTKFPGSFNWLQLKLLRIEFHSVYCEEDVGVVVDVEAFVDEGQSDDCADSSLDRRDSSE